MDQLREIYLMKKYATTFDTEPEYLASRGNNIMHNTVFFYHHAYIGAILNFSIFICFYLIKKFKSSFVTIFMLLFSLLLVCILWFINSKINLFICMLIVPLTGLFLFTKTKWAIGLVVVLSLVFVVFDATKNHPLLHKIKDIQVVQKNFNYEDKNTIIDYSRYMIYKKAWKEMQGSVLIFGVGLGDVKKTLNITNDVIHTIGKTDSLNAHSQFLHYLLGTGFIGLLFFLSFFTYLIYLSIIHRDFLLFSFIVIVSLNCLFENILSRVWGVYFISFFASLFVSKYLTTNE